jgi:tetratricopeptide (TPR) repeat protein
VTEPSAAFRAAVAGRYEIERELGAGGMAVVYLARDLKHDRRVALKVLRQEIAAGLGAERFVREIKVAAQLQHPHILPLFDSGEAGGLLYYVAPYVEGESLQELLRRERQLPVPEALAITRQVAGALAYAHSHGIVHRDIKPGNILLEGGEAIVADFGIALALSAAGGGERVTQTGLALGTPAYMSPEQAAGSEVVDRRTDIYSLGCVLFEMLAGEPPFTSPTPQGVVARQIHDAPPSLSTLRSAIPLAIEQTVERALAKVPADRFSTAAAFVEALDRIEAARLPRRRARWIGRAAAALSVVLVVAAVLVGRRVAGRNLDPGLHVVLPFAWRSGAVAAGLTGDQLESLLYDAMAHWGDVRMVGEIRAHDAWTQTGDTVATFRKALDVARKLGAGLLAWGEASIGGDSVVVVHAGLYDVTRGGRMVQEGAVNIPRTLSSVAAVGARFMELAQALLLQREAAGHERESVGPAVGTTSLAAFRAMLAGREAFDRWELARAESLWQEAVRQDPQYAQAQLWLAQTAQWSGRPASEWLVYARSAVTFAERLTNGSDSAMARGMLALAEGQNQEACEAFRAALRRDTLDVAAWFGLGECQRTDSVVVRDHRAPLGWRFRSSRHGAVTAYRRALELAPSFNNALGPAAYDRLSHLVVAERNLVRWGRAQPPDTGRFMAWPALDHDTLVSVPYPQREALTLAPPPTAGAAVNKGRTLLKDLVRSWVTAFPASARAHAAWALALEREGLLSEQGIGRQGALGETREALRLERDPALRVHLVLGLIRIHLKLQDFAGARRLSDSLLLRMPEPGQSSAWDLACLSALAGRAHRTAELMVRSAADTSFPLPDAVRPEVPLPVTAAALRLQAYASLGAPAESLAAVDTQIDQLLRRWVARQDDRATARHILEDYSTLWAFPVRRIHAASRWLPGYFLADIQWSLSRGDTSGARARLVTVRAAQAGFTPGDVLPALAYQQGFLLLAVHDTAAAESFLDLLLENLSAASTAMVIEPPQAAALVRAMALRAQVAARRGASAVAHRWAAAVVTLWSGSDLPELRALVDSLRAL